MSDEIGAAISAFISENTPRTPLEYSGDGEEYDHAFDDGTGEHYQEGDYDEFDHEHDEHYTGEHDEEGFDPEYGEEEATYEEGFDPEAGEEFYGDEAFADPDFEHGEGDAEAHGEFEHQVEGDGEEAFADPSLLDTIDGADERPSDLDEDALYELSDDAGDREADGAPDADPTDISEKLHGAEPGGDSDGGEVIEVIDADKAGKVYPALDTADHVSERVEDAAAAAAAAATGVAAAAAGAAAAAAPSGTEAKDDEQATAAGSKSEEGEPTKKPLDGQAAKAELEPSP